MNIFSSERVHAPLSQFVYFNVSWLRRKIGKCTSTVLLHVLAAPSDVQIDLKPSYLYGREDTVNCSAKFSTQSTFEILLEVCVNSSYFIAIENYTTPKQLLQQRQSEDGNCSHEIYLTNSIVFDHDMNVSLRCKATDSYLNTTLVTDCIKPNISIVPGKFIFVRCVRYTLVYIHI